MRQVCPSCLKKEIKQTAQGRDGSSLTLISVSVTLLLQYDFVRQTSSTTWRVEAPPTQGTLSEDPFGSGSFEEALLQENLRDLEIASGATPDRQPRRHQVMSSDLNVESIGALIPPSCVFEELPADLAVYEHVVARRHLQILPRLDCRDC